MAKKDDEGVIGAPSKAQVDRATKAVEAGKEDHSREVAVQIATGHAAPLDSGMAGPREEQERQVFEAIDPDLAKADDARVKDLKLGRDVTMDIPSGVERTRQEDAARATPGGLATLPTMGTIGSIRAPAQREGVTINGVHFTYTPGEGKRVPQGVASVIENKLNPIRTDQMKGGSAIPVVDLDAE